MLDCLPMTMRERSAQMHVGVADTSDKFFKNRHYKSYTSAKTTPATFENRHYKSYTAVLWPANPWTLVGLKIAD
jgi:hypothetical protein